MNASNEWLEADGLGGFASGTVSGIRTRRYHALLLSAVTPPTGRMVLVNGVEAWLETATGSVALSSHRYLPDVIHPDGASRIEHFTTDPWPTWRFVLADGAAVEHEIFVPHGSAAIILSWKLRARRVTKGELARLHVRPLLCCRDYHTLMRENPTFSFAAQEKECVSWQPYPKAPRITAFANGSYRHHPEWFRNFLYEEERVRGLDYLEDLASPGVFTFDLSKGEAFLLLAAVDRNALVKPRNSIETVVKTLRTSERRRRGRFPSHVFRSADAYVVQRGKGQTIIAGYPWFTDWGRDTFISLRGLCLATGNWEAARDVLLTWAGALSHGMLPNRFPDLGEEPEYNAVDASLWFVIAVHDFFLTLKRLKKPISPKNEKTLWETADAILEGYSRGTRHGIHLDADGLIAAGEPGVSLTWMDVLTPRIGKPVEVQALWLNVLWIRRSANPRWADLLERAGRSFRERFWNQAGGYLFDVVDYQHQPGSVDATFRPNQIFAVGGLPLVLLDQNQALQIVEAVETRLWTPLGLRTRAPEEPGYYPRYEGDVSQRDRSYHEGTVWPWLLGPFVEAWVRVHGGKQKAKKDARKRFLQPLLAHLAEGGFNHISEIADGDPPHTPRGCPFQAWSLGEFLRLDRWC
jgi:predicted glycogen debranching enzyme